MFVWNSNYLLSRPRFLVIFNFWDKTGDWKRYWVQSGIRIASGPGFEYPNSVTCFLMWGNYLWYRATSLKQPMDLFCSTFKNWQKQSQQQVAMHLCEFLRRFVRLWRCWGEVAQAFPNFPRIRLKVRMWVGNWASAGGGGGSGHLFSNEIPRFTRLRVFKWDVSFQMESLEMVFGSQ